jgi:hypothetical protein
MHRTLRAMFAGVVAISALAVLAGAGRAGSASAYLFSSGASPQFVAHPASWADHLPGVSYGFRRLHWSGWGTPTATASGEIRSCPNGAGCGAWSPTKMIAAARRSYACGGKSMNLYTTLAVVPRSSNVVFRPLGADLRSAGCHLADTPEPKSNYMGFAAGSTGPSHTFYVGDAIVLTFRASAAVPYRVCVSRPDGTSSRCSTHRTTRAGLADSITVAAPGSTGDYDVLWSVAGKQVAKWRLTIATGD